jgi:hypothetical protein
MCPQISSDLKGVTHDRLLTDVGELEQDLVLGEKNSKDLINFLTGGESCCWQSSRAANWVCIPWRSMTQWCTCQVMAVAWYGYQQV